MPTITNPQLSQHRCIHPAQAFGRLNLVGVDVEDQEMRETDPHNVLDDGFMMVGPYIEAYQHNRSASALHS